MTAFAAHERWALDFGLILGGLVLRNVRHDRYHLARDIRTARIWVDTTPPSRPSTNGRDWRGGKNLQSYILNSEELPASGGVSILGTNASETRHPRPPFAAYETPYGLEASFRSSVDYLSGSLNQVPISVTQRYLFGEYGKNPAHEPGAVLQAARLFPLLRFEFPPVADRSVPYPAYFRADFRIDVDLDNITESEIKRNALGPDKTMNKAGVFRDYDELMGLFGAGVSAVKGHTVPNSILSTLFAFYEKPISAEIASWGLARVGELPGVAYNETWDNVHIWPARRGVSSPGAFHALHCHWRWGAVAGDPSPSGAGSGEIPAAGQPQFKGLGWTKSSGGPLIDSSLPLQNLRFAIADAADTESDPNASEQDFASLFTKRFPRAHRAGSNVALWLSFEVMRGMEHVGETWGGWLFINGLYFAHNVDETPFMLRLAGAYGNGQRSGLGRSDDKMISKWERLARDD